MTLLPKGAAPGQTLTFDFASDRYLARGQHDGALAYLTQGASGTTPLPVVVFLHGLNPKQALHPWFNGDPGDLREEFNALVASGKLPPMVIAAPTQSKDATVPRRMWPEFDLDGFIDATQRALEGRAVVDRARVVLVGHSGGGCNAKGGIVAAASRARTPPLGLVAVDTCLDPDIAEGLLAAPRSTRVWVTWQTATWSRPFEQFKASMEGAPVHQGPSDRHLEERPPLRPSPHNAILPETLRRALPLLLGKN